MSVSHVIQIIVLALIGTACLVVVIQPLGPAHHITGTDKDQI